MGIKTINSHLGPRNRGIQSISATTAFTPASIPGLVAWYNMNAGNVTKDGSNNVSQINDLSGNGYNLTQSVGASQPLWQANQLNSYAVPNAGIKFIANSSLTLAQPFSIYVVVKASEIGTTICGDEAQFTDIFYNSNASPLARIEAPIGLGSTIISLNTWQIWDGEFNGGSSNIYINTTNYASGNTGTHGLTEFQIGYSGNPDAGLYVAEVVIYNSVLSSANRAKLFAYLDSKYAIY